MPLSGEKALLLCREALRPSDGSLMVEPVMTADEYSMRAVVADWTGVIAVGRVDYNWNWRWRSVIIRRRGSAVILYHLGPCISRWSSSKPECEHSQDNGQIFLIHNQNPFVIARIEPHQCGGSCKASRGQLIARSTQAKAKRGRAAPMTRS